MSPTDPSPRSARVERRTRETAITLELTLDLPTTDLPAPEPPRVATGLGFLDHMLATLAFHAGWQLELECAGDLEVDDHHTVEDCALALGEALDRALGERRGIARFGWALAPLDEALARVAIDLSGRPAPVVDLGLARDAVGGVAAENLEHFFRSLAVAARAALHVDVLRGTNDHHRAEAAFKAAALALRQAVARRGGDAPPSTKGSL